MTQPPTDPIWRWKQHRSTIIGRLALKAWPHSKEPLLPFITRKDASVQAIVLRTASLTNPDNSQPACK